MSIGKISDFIRALLIDAEKELDKLPDVFDDLTDAELFNYLEGRTSAARDILNYIREARGK